MLKYTLTYCRYTQVNWLAYLDCASTAMCCLWLLMLNVHQPSTPASHWHLKNDKLKLWCKCIWPASLSVSVGLGIQCSLSFSSFLHRCHVYFIWGLACSCRFVCGQHSADTHFQECNEGFATSSVGPITQWGKDVYGKEYREKEPKRWSLWYPSRQNWNPAHSCSDCDV